MAFDGFINYAITSELNNELIGGKINKIHQPNKDELILSVYAKTTKYNLLICINSNNCRYHLTNDVKPNPASPLTFCMLLRKHLIGAKIKKIYTNGLDRLTTIEFETYNEMGDLIVKKLQIELMGKHSNVILLNDNNIIIDSMRHINSSSSERIILPANPYVIPSTSKKDFLATSIDEFISSVESNGSLINLFSNKFIGFSKIHLKYVLNKLKINDSSYNKQDIITIYNYICNLITHIHQLKIDCIDFFVDTKNDYVLICSENMSNLKINNFVDYYYTRKEKFENFKNYKANILKIILKILKKYTRKLNNINSRLEECKDLDRYRMYGELITSNLYQINNNINVKSIVVPNYYDNNKEIEIPLDDRFCPSVNARNFFKKYHKLKNTLSIVTSQKQETGSELNYIESIIYSLENSDSIQEIDEIYTEIKENILKEPIKKSKQKNMHLSQLISIDIDGYKILIGRNNKQNDYLTFKVADKSDIWFHAKDIQGSHVILRNSHNEISDDIITKCASLAAYYSKARTSTKVEVQYTQVKNIKKPKNSKPGFVVFNKYTSIFVEPKQI